MFNLNRLSRTLCITSSCLLLVMAIFHVSGISYINDLIAVSDVPEFIKQIFPVLFIVPSIQLAGLAAFGMIATSMKQGAQKLLVALSVLVLVDALLAFYLGALIPGFVLTLPSLLFLFIAIRLKPVKASIQG